MDCKTEAEKKNKNKKKIKIQFFIFLNVSQMNGNFKRFVHQRAKHFGNDHKSQRSFDLKEGQ